MCGEAQQQVTQSPSSGLTSGPVSPLPAPQGAVQKMELEASCGPRPRGPPATPIPGEPSAQRFSLQRFPQFGDSGSPARPSGSLLHRAVSFAPGGEGQLPAELLLSAAAAHRHTRLP